MAGATESKHDWKATIRTVAPALATALGSPLLGTAVSVLSNLFFGKSDATEAEVQEYVNKGIPPDTIVKLREIDNKFKLDLEAAGLNLKKLEAETEQAYITDVQNARSFNSTGKGTFWMGVCILITFAAVVGGVLWGCFALLTGGLPISVTDPGIIAAVFGFIGTVVGYVASNAQQVVGFEFGSSRGSHTKSDSMAEAVKTLSVGVKR